MTRMISELTIILVLILINGLFSGAEIAIVTVRKTKIRQWVEEGHRGAKAIQKLREIPEQFLATVQIGITLVGAAAAAYGGDTLATRLTPVLEPFLGQTASQVSFSVVVACIAYVSLILGELVPKSLALRSSETYALFVSRPLLWLSMLGKPIVWFLTTSSNLVLMLFGDKTSFTEARISPDEIKSMLEEAGEVGAVSERVGEIASRAVDLNALRASHLLVPRGQMLVIAKEATLEGLKKVMASAPHSKVVVYEGSLDQVVGYVSVKDAFLSVDQVTHVRDILKPIIFVPEVMRAIDILQTFQTKRVELAIVVDEHGGTSGLITKEDLMDALMGEMLPNS